ncbi:MAG: hypothetical protein Q9174_005911, partial [Haloplaca sp. 1 TL-2023]
MDERKDGTQCLPSHHGLQPLNSVAGLCASELTSGDGTSVHTHPHSETRSASAPVNEQYSRENCLRAVAKDIMTNHAYDSELSRILNREYFQLDRRARPSMEAVQQAIVETLAQVEDIVSAREAVIALANASMNSTETVKHLNMLHRNSSHQASTHDPDPSTPVTPSPPTAILSAAAQASTPDVESTSGSTLPSVAQDGDARENASSHEIAKNKEDQEQLP